MTPEISKAVAEFIEWLPVLIVIGFGYYFWGNNGN